MEKGARKEGVLLFKTFPRRANTDFSFTYFFFGNFAGKEGLHEVYNCKIEERLERTNW